MMNLFPQAKINQTNPVAQEEAKKPSLIGKRVRVKSDCWNQEAIGSVEADRGWPVGFVEVRVDEGQPPPKVRICLSPDDYELLEEGES